MEDELKKEAMKFAERSRDRGRLNAGMVFAIAAGMGLVNAGLPVKVVTRSDLEREAAIAKAERRAKPPTRAKEKARRLRQEARRAAKDQPISTREP